MIVNRFWFYLPAVILTVALGSYLSWIGTRQNSETVAIEQQAAQQRRQSIDGYLQKQDDGRKLVSLAKALQFSAPELVEPVILKAYALLPNSRDVAILASYYRPELKERVKELDPLYEQ